MKLLVRFFTVAAATTTVAMSVQAPSMSAAAPAPMSIESCSLSAAASPKWPMRRLRVELRNTSRSVADLVRIGAGGVGAVTVHGQFPPGSTTVKDLDLGNRFATLVPGALACSVTAVHLSGAHS